jgi:hypothetical protein
MQQEFPMRRFLTQLVALGLSLSMTATTVHAGGRGSSGGSKGTSSHSSSSMGSSSYRMGQNHSSSYSSKMNSKQYSGSNWKGSMKSPTYSPKYSKGYDSKGYCHYWSKCCWSGRYGCYCFWCPEVCGWYYWDEGAYCYYPVTYAVAETAQPEAPEAAPQVVEAPAELAGSTPPPSAAPQLGPEVVPPQ